MSIRLDSDWRFDCENPRLSSTNWSASQTDRQVKKLILLAWCAAIIADHDYLSELLLAPDIDLPRRIGKKIAGNRADS